MKIRAFLFASAFLLLFALTAGLAVAGPSVRVSLTPNIINVGDEATYTLTVSPPATREIRVNIFVSGTALPNGYELIGNFNGAGQVVIPSGQSQSFITLRALEADSRPSTTVLFDVRSGNYYRVGSPSRAKLTILNPRHP
jgi:hypothetical protein